MEKERISKRKYDINASTWKASEYKVVNFLRLYLHLSLAVTMRKFTLIYACGLRCPWRTWKQPYGTDHWLPYNSLEINMVVSGQQIPRYSKLCPKYGDMTTAQQSTEFRALSPIGSVLTVLYYEFLRASQSQSDAICTDLCSADVCLAGRSYRHISSMELWNLRRFSSEGGSEHVNRGLCFRRL